MREYEDILLKSFDFICKQSATFLTDLAAFTNYPDLVYDLFGMCLRYLRYSKHILFRSQNLEILLTLWMRGIGLEHKEAVSTHSSFFIELVKSLKRDLSKVSDLQN